MTNFFETTVGQHEQFNRLLAQAGFTSEDVKRVLAEPALAGTMHAALRAELAQPERFYPQRDYSRLDSLLNSLDEQLRLLRQLNSRMPNELRVNDAWLDLDASSDHRQTVEDLECWFVVIDTLEATWAFNQKLVELTQPAIYDSGFDRTAQSMRLHRLARQYEPGVHRVRINLVDNWDPEKGRSIDQVRERASAASKQLAAVEAVGAYALQKPQLYQSQDGEKLPYFDCAGIEQGDGFRHVPCSLWGGFDRGVFFRASRSGYVGRGCAAPSLVA